MWTVPPPPALDPAGQPAKEVAAAEKAAAESAAAESAAAGSAATGSTEPAAPPEPAS